MFCGPFFIQVIQFGFGIFGALILFFFGWCSRGKNHIILLWGTLKNKLEKLTKGKCHQGMQSLHDVQKLSNVHSSLNCQYLYYNGMNLQGNQFWWIALQYFSHVLSFSMFNTSSLFIWHHEYESCSGPLKRLPMTDRTAS